MPQFLYNLWINQKNKCLVWLLGNPQDGVQEKMPGISNCVLVTTSLNLKGRPVNHRQLLPAKLANSNANYMIEQWRMRTCGKTSHERIDVRHKSAGVSQDCHQSFTGSSYRIMFVTALHYLPFLAFYFYNLAFVLKKKRMCIMIANKNKGAVLGSFWHWIPSLWTLPQTCLRIAVYNVTTTTSDCKGD